jgi:hypothetical protein
MDPEDQKKLREDLKAQAYEHSRRLLASLASMIGSDTEWKQDTFFSESTKHLQETSQCLGKWHLQCRLLLNHTQPLSQESPAESNPLR